MPVSTLPLTNSDMNVLSDEKHNVVHKKVVTNPFMEMKKDRCIQLGEILLETLTNKEDVTKDFYEQTEISKFHLGNLILTKREAQSLYFLIRGKSVKETAKIMELFPRTIETYICSIKRKTGITQKTKIIDKLFNAISYLDIKHISIK